VALTKTNLADINLGDLQELVDNAIPETNVLEYKLRYDAADWRLEYLKDISALANTNGGHVLVGVAERDGGIASNVAGIADDNSDAKIRQYEAIARTGLQPRIQGLQMHAVALRPDSYVVVIRVPASGDAPHRVISDNSNRFWMRNSRGCYEPDVNELRASFTSGATEIERLRAFRKSRVRQICNGEITLGAIDSPLLIAHIFPRSAFSSTTLINLRNAYEMATQELRPIAGGMNIQSRFNLEGIQNIRGGRLRVGYTHLFRNGIVEATKSISIVGDPARAANIAELTWHYFGVLPRYLMYLRSLGAYGPYTLTWNLLGLGGVSFLSRNRLQSASGPCPLDSIELPEVVIQDEMDVADCHRAVRPMLDALWNTVDHPGDPNYDDAGNWRTPA
jgi:hypothetical protein